jgi:glutathione S-transferase
VPVLEHAGFSLYESQAILRYLDRVRPTPALITGDSIAPQLAFLTQTGMASAGFAARQHCRVAGADGDPAEPAGHHLGSRG